MDLLRWPAVGVFLRWRHARTSLQLGLLLLSAVVVLHGLFGPTFAPANLSTVLTWVHYRGLLVVALLAAGNLFCTGCPFVRVRDWGRLLHMPRLAWPARLRGKWTGILLFAAVLYAYELFDLWALPAATAYLVLAYFGAALAIDLVFTGATFCKHLCPIGQFNFVASTVSPLEVRPRSDAVCASCRTEDCIAGRRDRTPARAVVQRGCELGLFLPSKVGNLDCTFCLDCVQACPHDNVALAVRAPALELADPRRRSGVGVIGARVDLAALVVIFVFGAYLNAFAMVAPARRFEAWLGSLVGTTSEAVTLGLILAMTLVVVPALLLGLAGWLTVTLSQSRETVGAVVTPMVYGLVPLGFGLWVAHYGFHLLTGIFTAVPVTQSAAIDWLGRPVLGEPLWQWAGMRPNAVLPIQLGVIALGAMGSLGITSLISSRQWPEGTRGAGAPWLLLILALAVAACWILFQPMEMRAVGGGA